MCVISLGASYPLKNTVYFFLLFDRSGKSTNLGVKTKFLQIVQSVCIVITNLQWRMPYRY